jgi:hypothetical protein
MSCSVRSRQGLRRLAAAPGQLAHVVHDGDKPRDYEVTGTWDFKWPLGSEIRVAFQKPPLAMNVDGDEFEEVVGLVREYAERWPLPHDIRFDFKSDPGEFLEPPLGPENSSTDQHRSAFDLETTQRIKYDVLVSFQDLPLIRLDPFRAPGQEIDHVLFPVSELGSYARRTDYGAPTMYIGRFGHALKDGFANYYRKNPLAQHVTVHEFGHALGIPHMHQHPDLILPRDADDEEVPSENAKYSELDRARADFYKPIAEVQQVILDALGIEVTPDIVREHLIEVFRGNKAFSDWVVLDEVRKLRHRAQAALDSVMTMPLYQCCSKVGKQRDCTRLMNVITTPRDIDIQMLTQMYTVPQSNAVTINPPAPGVPKGPERAGHRRRPAKASGAGRLRKR